MSLLPPRRQNLDGGLGTALAASVARKGGPSGFVVVTAILIARVSEVSLGLKGSGRGGDQSGEDELFEHRLNVSAVLLKLIIKLLAPDRGL